MITTKYFKEDVKNTPCASKNATHILLRGFNRTKSASFKTLFLGTLLAILTLSGCSTIGQQVVGATDALKTDVQTAHDENFRIKRVRKALLSGDVQAAEEHRDTLYSTHWRSIANIEIAAAKYQANSQEALKIVERTTEEIWNISDANHRAMALLALLKFELETEGDIPQAKETIKQTEKTIAFILDDHARKMRRYGELQTLLGKHNHLLSR